MVIVAGAEDVAEVITVVHGAGEGGRCGLG
jgi:hypothetical protein